MCPICKSEQKEIILNFNCGRFDGSKLYRTVRIASCSSCGHIFNDLKDREIEDLDKYYNNEYAPINFEIINKPGGVNVYNNLSEQNYCDLFKIVQPCLKINSNILDIGCKTGGFLSYLGNQGFRNIFGSDTIQPYVDYAKKNIAYSVEYGSPYKLPYENDFFDFINMNQVLEHISDPIGVFTEINRVLKDGGFLSIGLPDAERYNNFYFFDLYWFLLREHIQHFDSRHLFMLASQNGFKLTKYVQADYNMMSGTMVMPNFYAVFKLNKNYKNYKNDSKNIEKFLLKKNITSYINNEKKNLTSKKDNLKYSIMSKSSIYIWGIGREFFYMYENLGLKQCNNLNLIDSNVFKQNNFHVDGMEIKSPSVLESAPLDSVIIISAIAHKESIKRHIGLSKYKGEIFEF